METTPSPSSLNFTGLSDESAFTRRHHHLHTTTVHHLTPPDSLSSDSPWIFTSSSATPAVFLHPLTSKPHSFNFSYNLDRSNTLAVSYHLDSPYRVDKLLVCHGSTHLTQPSPSQLNNNLTECTMLALYRGGELRACPRFFEVDENSPWVKLSQPGVKFDDITFHKGVIYAVGRQMRVTSIDVHPSIPRKISIAKTLDSSGPSCRFGWRKRFVGDGESLYIVIRTEEQVFKLYKRKRLVMQQRNIVWEVVKGFEGSDKVLFMSKYHYFFRNVSEKFLGREYKNCIVFSEAAFPQYGNDCWEFSQSGDRQFGEEDIAIFRLNDGTFARDGENPCFPKIDWSPPAWVFNASSADESRSNVSPQCHSQSERGPDGDEGLKSASRDKNDGGKQSDMKDLDGKEKGEQEEMEYAFSNKDQDQKGMASGSDSQDQEDGKMQCDSNSQDEDEDMHSKANIEGDASSKEEGTPTEVLSLSLFTGEEEVGRTLLLWIAGLMQLSKGLQEKISFIQHLNLRLRLSFVRQQFKAFLSLFNKFTGEEEVARVGRTLLSMDSGSDAIEEGTSGKNIIYSTPKSSTSSTTQNHKSDSGTTKFEEFEIRSDLVPTLEKIWVKHGNIVKDSIVQNSYIIAASLETLAIMVRLLEDNSAQSLSDTQANYLRSTLSDLRSIHFDVDWLSYFVEKALNLHKSKSLEESLNNLRLLNSQTKERRAILLDELTKLDVEETKQKEEMEKVSEMISLYGRAMSDEPVGAGLT